MTDDTAELRDLLARLRAADSRFRVFGSSHHGYRLGPPLAERELAAFESANGARLPAEYRRFLAAVGNGGAGPYYGLEPLGTFGRDLSRPFPYVAAIGTGGAEEPDRDELPGVLEFCHQGCACYAYLVVNGPAYGSVWIGREEFVPTGMGFGEWYRRWLERVLRLLSNEPLVPRLRVGMTRADVAGATGGGWKARPALGRDVRYFESPDIPAQLELNERDVVVAVRPWPFIS